MSQWRSRAFHLTRNRAFLLRVAGGIVGVCGLISVAMLVVEGKEWPRPVMEAPTGEELVQTYQTVRKEEYELLRKSSSKEPERVVNWLLDLELLEGQSFDPTTLTYAGMDLRSMPA